MNNDALSDARLKADKLAETLHEGQTDKLGNPYIDHVRDVADRVSSLGANYFIVGLLHDSVEDTDITLEKIEEEFGKDVRDGVDGMTKREGEDYFDDY
ncbi:MAG: HD domain-containing protein, partial [Alphaproteobacteria bacterium]|nr:HD domain-containing protein [Alphaproteobacteria bacterium]